MGLTYLGFRAVPAGFIPQQDKGYLVLNAQLPDGASPERTEEVMARMRQMALETKGVTHAISVPGYSVLLGTNLPNVGGMFVILEPFEERKGRAELSALQIMSRLRQSGRTVQEAQVVVFGAPPVDGLGSTGGFKMQVQDRGDLGLPALQGAVENMAQVEAALQAAKLRLRAILMTSFSFILGVVPLIVAKGAGAEMRLALGIAVFSGMIGVTLFGIFFTPVFYVVVRWFTERAGLVPAGPAKRALSGAVSVATPVALDPDGYAAVQDKPGSAAS